MAALTEIRVPDLGGSAEVNVIDVLVKAGDTIEVDTLLITLETEKATMDVPSTAAGRVAAVQVKKGMKISQGAVILTLEGGAADAAPSPPPKAASAPAPAPSPTRAAAPAATSVSAPTPPPFAADATIPHPAQRPSKPAANAPSVGAAAPAAAPPVTVSADSALAHASPSVRKFARELGVDLARVQGTGPKGRISHDDVKAFVKQAMTTQAPPAKAAPPASAAAAGGGLPKLPVVDFALFGPVEVKPLSRIQKISGPRLHASWVNIPHVTQFDEADITEMEETRQKLKDKAAKQGIKLTPLSFIIKACVKALQEFPHVNASLDETGKNLVLKKYIHIGFAADTPHGLVVPVIRDADRKDIYEIARDLGELSAKARDGKLGIADMQGGCFTVSSLGGIGGTAFTPIINAPEVAILGVSRSDHKPVYINGGFVPRLILPLSLSYDHRAIDGVMGVKFTTFLAKKLADVKSLLEAIP